MKAKILLLLAAVIASSIGRAQFPLKTILNQKKTPHNQVTKALSPTINVNTDQQVTLEEVNRSSPIIIDYSNNLVPREANDDNIFISDQQIPVPSIGENQIYDFGNLTYEAENFFTNTLVRPPMPHMSGDRTSLQIPGNIIDFNGLLVDTAFIIYETNNQGLFITKIHFTGAKTSLQAITGVVTDSLIIPE